MTLPFVMCSVANCQAHDKAGLFARLDIVARVCEISLLQMQCQLTFGSVPLSWWVHSKMGPLHHGKLACASLAGGTMCKHCQTPSDTLGHVSFYARQLHATRGPKFHQTGLISCLSLVTLCRITLLPWRH